MMVILDNGHGINTDGKCSPDRRLIEAVYARDIVRRVHAALTAEGIPSTILIPEDTDIPLSTRTTRANKIYNEQHRRETILVSVHVDGFGLGKEWFDDRGGWSVRISPNASTLSKTLADCIEAHAHDLPFPVRRQYANKSYWVQSLWICSRSACPAVLTENLHQTNRAHVDYLLTEEGKQSIVDLHVAGIKDYFHRLNLIH